MRFSSIAPTSPLSRTFAVLFALGLLYSFAMLLRPDEHFLSRPFIEDAFYSLSAARSLGEGRGISIDGVTPSNGVQPLICFLYAPAFAIAGDRLTDALRIALGIEVILGGLAALALAWFAVSLMQRDDRSTVDGWVDQRRDLFWIVAGTVAASYSLLTHLHNGLETALAAGFVFAAMAMYIERIARADDAPPSEFARLGVLLGLGVLARIDIAILAAAIAGWHAIAARRRTARATNPFVGAAIIGGVSFLVSLPWWLYNLIGFGHLMPTSGLAQKDLLVDRFENLDNVLRGISNSILLVLHSPADVDGAIAYAGLIALAAALLLLSSTPAMRRWRDAAVGRTRAMLELRDAVPLALFLGVLVVYYALFFGAPHFIARYLTSMWLALTVGMLATLYAFWRTAEPGSIRRRAMMTLAAGAVAASAAAQSRHFSDEGLFTNVMLYPARWIGEHTAEGERIGMFQSGTTGFLYRRVTNLDGKVNPRALEALRTGTVARFADSAAFDYIIDLDFYTRHIFHDAAVRAHYEPIDTLPFGFVVWRRLRQ